MKYSKKTLEYFYHPKNVGRFDAAPNIGVGIVDTKENGEVIELQIKIEKNIIKDSKFLAFGGVVVVAAMQWITEWLKDKTVTEAKQINEAEISSALEIPTVKRHAVLLAIDAVKIALNKY